MYTTYQIGGHKRGRLLGVPTINLKIPLAFSYNHGIYAASITLHAMEKSPLGRKKTYGVALHFGPKPTFHEDDVTLEAFLIGYTESFAYDANHIDLSIIQYLRPILHFTDPDLLVVQIQDDVKKISHMLDAIGS
jgi:FAD synthase